MRNGNLSPSYINLSPTPTPTNVMGVSIAFHEQSFRRSHVHEQSFRVPRVHEQSFRRSRMCTIILSEMCVHRHVYNPRSPIFHRQTAQSCAGEKIMKRKSTTTQLKSYVGDVAVQDGNAVQRMKVSSARVHIRRAQSVLADTPYTAELQTIQAVYFALLHNPEQSHD